MYTIIFTEKEWKNLQEFLNRTNIQGREVPAYIEIIKKILEAKKEEK